jgi:hypothetical protein
MRPGLVFCMEGKLPDTPRKSDDALAREVDKLLRKLPGADPYLKGEPEAIATKSPSMGPGVLTSSGSRPAVRGFAPTRVQRIGVWVRVWLGVLLGALITQWPYARNCGIGLWFYLGAVTALLIAGGWGGVWSWRYRMGLAHSTSIAVIFWTLVLASDQVLQRTGYAASSAQWSCGTGVSR